MSADTQFQPAADGIHVTPVQLDTGNAAVDTLIRLTLGSRVSFVISTTKLPFGQHVQSVTAGPPASPSQRPARTWSSSSNESRPLDRLRIAEAARPVA